MSFHLNPKYQIPALIKALKDHGLEHDKPSQLSDAFRTGWMAAQSTSQPLVEVREPGLLQGRSRIGWGEEWGDWEEIPAGEWSIWRHRVENFPDGYELREWFAAPVRGLSLTEERKLEIWMRVSGGDLEGWGAAEIYGEEIEAAHGIKEGS